MGNNRGKYSRDQFDPLKNYSGAKLQQSAVGKPIPLVDSDFNDVISIMKEGIQSLRHLGFGDGRPALRRDGQQNYGFNIAQSSPVAIDDFVIRGGAGTAEGAGRFWISGFELFIGQNIPYKLDGSAITEASDLIHHRATSISTDGTVLYDTAASFGPVDNLAGRTLVSITWDDTNQVWEEYEHLITANTDHTITLNTSLLNDTLDFVAADRTDTDLTVSLYRLKLDAVTGATRTDDVYLDVYEDEYDYLDDPTLNHNLSSGTPIVGMVRTKMVSRIWIIQDADSYGSSFEDYTDTDGNLHRVLRLASIDRTTGQSIITSTITEYYSDIAYGEVDLDDIVRLDDGQDSVAMIYFNSKVATTPPFFIPGELLWFGIDGAPSFWEGQVIQEDPGVSVLVQTTANGNIDTPLSSIPVGSTLEGQKSNIQVDLVSYTDQDKEVTTKIEVKARNAEDDSDLISTIDYYDNRRAAIDAWGNSFFSGKISSRSFDFSVSPTPTQTHNIVIHGFDIFAANHEVGEVYAENSGTIHVNRYSHYDSSDRPASSIQKRDFIVYNGDTVKILEIDGSSHSVTIYDTLGVATFTAIPSSIIFGVPLVLGAGFELDGDIKFSDSAAGTNRYVYGSDSTSENTGGDIRIVGGDSHTAGSTTHLGGACVLKGGTPTGADGYSVVGLIAKYYGDASGMGLALKPTRTTAGMFGPSSVSSIDGATINTLDLGRLAAPWGTLYANGTSSSISVSPAICVNNDIVFKFDTTPAGGASDSYISGRDKVSSCVITKTSGYAPSGTTITFSGGATANVRTMLPNSEDSTLYTLYYTNLTGDVTTSETISGGTLVGAVVDSGVANNYSSGGDLILRGGRGSGNTANPNQFGGSAGLTVGTYVGTPIYTNTLTDPHVYLQFYAQDKTLTKVVAAPLSTASHGKSYFGSDKVIDLGTSAIRWGKGWLTELDVSGAATFNGGITLGNAASDSVTVTGGFVSNLTFQAAQSPAPGTAYYIYGSNAHTSGRGGDTILKAGNAAGVGYLGGRLLLSSGNVAGSPTVAGDITDPRVTLSSYKTAAGPTWNRFNLVFGPKTSAEGWGAFFGEEETTSYAPDLGRGDYPWGTAFVSEIKPKNSASTGTNLVVWGGHAGGFGNDNGGNVSLSSGSPTGSGNYGIAALTSGTKTVLVSEQYDTFSALTTNSVSLGIDSVRWTNLYSYELDIGSPSDTCLVVNYAKFDYGATDAAENVAGLHSWLSAQDGYIGQGTHHNGGSGGNLNLGAGAAGNADPAGGYSATGTPGYVSIYGGNAGDGTSAVSSGNGGDASVSAGYASLAAGAGGNGGNGLDSGDGGDASNGGLATCTGGNGGDGGNSGATLGVGGDGGAGGAARIYAGDGGDGGDAVGAFQVGGDGGTGGNAIIRSGNFGTKGLGSGGATNGSDGLPGQVLFYIGVNEKARITAEGQLCACLQVTSGTPFYNNTAGLIWVDGDDLCYFTSAPAKLTLTGTFTGHHYFKSDLEFDIGKLVSLTTAGILVATTQEKSPLALGLQTRDILVSKDSRGTRYSDLQRVIQSACVGDTVSEECKGAKVCNANGPINPGDLMCSSNVPGRMMKQPSFKLAVKEKLKSMFQAAKDALTETSSALDLINALLTAANDDAHYEEEQLFTNYTVAKNYDNVVFDENGNADDIYATLHAG